MYHPRRKACQAWHEGQGVQALQQQVRTEYALLLVALCRGGGRGHSLHHPSHTCQLRSDPPVLCVGGEEIEQALGRAGASACTVRRGVMQQLLGRGASRMAALGGAQSALPPASLWRGSQVGQSGQALPLAHPRHIHDMA